jgi:crossover junction endodeoxyribonuclease RuvC
LLILGLDPGLGTSGWGVISALGNRLSHIAHGQISTDPKTPLAERLVALERGLADVIQTHQPDCAAVEEVFVNTNAQSTLKLGQARGVCLLVAARSGLPVAEYATRLVKKAVVGTGAAEKTQVQAMLRILLPGAAITGADAADALAVAICHAHHGTARNLTSR